MAKTTVRRVGTIVVGLSLFAAACGSDEGGGADTTGAAGTEAPATTEAAATSEAPDTTAAAAGGDTAGALAGMKGTTPLLELSQDFKDKLLAIDPALQDFNYAAETYDAVNIIALAAAEGQDRRDRLRQGDQRHHPRR